MIYYCPNCGEPVKYNQHACQKCKTALVKKSSTRSFSFLNTLPLYIIGAIFFMIALLLEIIANSEIYNNGGIVGGLIVAEIIAMILVIVSFVVNGKTGRNSTAGIAFVLLSIGVINFFNMFYQFIDLENTGSGVLSLFWTSFIIFIFVCLSKNANYHLKQILLLIFFIIYFISSIVNLINAIDLYDSIPYGYSNQRYILQDIYGLEIAAFVFLMLFSILYIINSAVSFRNRTIVNNVFLGLTEKPFNENHVTSNKVIENYDNQESDNYAQKQVQNPTMQESVFDDKVHKIRELKYLLDDGIITQEEFDAKKADIMKEM